MDLREKGDDMESSEDSEDVNIHVQSPVSALAEPIEKRLKMDESIAEGSTSVPAEVSQHPRKNKIEQMTTQIGTYSWNFPRTAKKVQSPVPAKNPEKCRNFLANLLEASEREPVSVRRRTQKLVQKLIDGKINPEKFCGKLRLILNASPQPCLESYLKVNRDRKSQEESTAAFDLSLEGGRFLSAQRIDEQHVIDIIGSLERELKEFENSAEGMSQQPVQTASYSLPVSPVSYSTFEIDKEILVPKMERSTSYPMDIFSSAVLSGSKQEGVKSRIFPPESAASDLQNDEEFIKPDKCRKFLKNLLKSAKKFGDVEKYVHLVGLIQDLIDDQLGPEEFIKCRLPRLFMFSPRPFLIPFLEENLPPLRQSLRSGTMIIPSIEAPLQDNKPLTS